MRSYLEILSELKVALDSDTTIPKNDKEAMNELMFKLFDILWNYSY